MTFTNLPLPSLLERRFASIPLLTDDALADAIGVRVVFSGRDGGASMPPFDSLNLGDHVGDAHEDVLRNRELLLGALGAGDYPLIAANQVHGVSFVEIDSADESALGTRRALAGQGADGILVDVAGVAALLCFADCASVAVVSPTGRFAIAHAGWRGAVAGIASSAVRKLAAADEALLGRGEEGRLSSADYNVYIGPHIHEECFETGDDVRQRFIDAFGADCAPHERHVSLAQAIRADVCRVGVSPERVLDSGCCTLCEPQRFFSYRAAGGTCGRHGLVAFQERR